MTLPAVNVTILDNQLGVTSTGTSVHAVVGLSSTGTPNLPSSFASVPQLVDAFGQGPGVEAAALAIQAGATVLFTKVAEAAEGELGTLDDTGVQGTSVITVGAAGQVPVDDLDIYVEFTAGGTVGTSGVKYRYAVDVGKTLSPTLALGTSTTIEIPDAITLDLAPGTLIAGDWVAVRAEGPTYTATELSPALDAIAKSSTRFNLVHVVGPVTSAIGGLIDGKLDTMAAANKPIRWIGNTRLPNENESSAAYQLSLQALSDAYASNRAAICAGAIKQVSAISGRQYRRPLSFRIAAEQAVVSEEIDIADVNRGALQGTQILDSNGNPEDGFHNEATNPGLDDMRFVTARTWPTLAGVYCTRPRSFSAQNSDFRLICHGLVMDLAQIVAYQNLLRRLNQPIMIDATTGHIIESDAREIESGCQAALSQALLSRPKASAVSVSVSRTDNLLSNGTLHVTIRIVPLAYIETINCELSFYNPAVVAA